MISVITATFNKLELSQAYLSSLEANPPPEPWEIIWVDDGSTDGTRDWLKTLQGPRHRVIYNNQNLGYAASNNKGALQASGDVLCFLNNDLILTPNWFPPLIRALKQIDNPGVVGNIQIGVATQRIDHAGMGFDLIGRTIHPHKGSRISDIRGKGNCYKAVTAACWVVYKSVFIEAGGFDSAFRNGFEDADLCLRLGQKGYQHWVSYEIPIYHHVSSSPGRKDRDAENLALFLNKWAPLTSVYGQTDWPLYYIRRIIHQPSHLNAGKLIDALLRITRLRHGDSAWARRERIKAMSTMS